MKRYGSRITKLEHRSLAGQFSIEGTVLEVLSDKAAPDQPARSSSGRMLDAWTGEEISPEREGKARKIVLSPMIIKRENIDALSNVESGGAA